MNIHIAIIAGILIGFVLVVIGLALFDLFFGEDDLEEMSWLPLDEDRDV